MLVSFPGAGCDPRAVGIVDSESLGNRCDKHTFSAMGHADEVEPVVERDLASLGDASCLKGSWFRRLTGGSQGPWWGWAASERQKKLRVGDGLGRAIREGDQPGREVHPFNWTLFWAPLGGIIVPTPVGRFELGRCQIAQG